MKAQEFVDEVKKKVAELVVILDNLDEAYETACRKVERFDNATMDRELTEEEEETHGKLGAEVDALMSLKDTIDNGAGIIESGTEEAQNYLNEVE